jgi:hypothetical protein
MKTMGAPRLATVRLPAEGIRALLEQKQQIRDAATGTCSERLLQATVQGVLCLARQEPARHVLSPQVLDLAREVLRGLAQRKWNTDTALLLRKSELGKRDQDDGHTR